MQRITTNMRMNRGIVLLIITASLVGCREESSFPKSATPDTNTTSPSNLKNIGNSDAVSEPVRFASLPVQSAELTGVWYGVTRETGVVVRFIGRQSREPDTRGVVSGNWIVHVDRGSVCSAIEFVDNEQSGAVDLEVGMVSGETNELFTAGLGRIQRGSDGGLYLSIDENTSTDMYVPANHIRLQRIIDAVEITPATIKQMQAARERLQDA